MLRTVLLRSTSAWEECFCFALAVSIRVSVLLVQPAYGHFYGGQTDNFGSYSVVCVPSPDPPVARDNNTKLNFSVLNLGDNIYNIVSAVTVKDKTSGAIVFQSNFRPFEFSDISIPAVFPKPGNYIVTLVTKVVGDSKYSETPLSADFTVTAMYPNTYVPLYQV